MQRRWLDTRQKTISDLLDKGRETKYQYTRILVRARSRVQEILLVNLLRFGTSLWIRVLGGEDVPGIQFDRAHEHHYHQLFGLTPLAAHPGAEIVGVLGGGDIPLSLRVLSARSVKSVEYFDWDRMVLPLVLKHCPWIRMMYHGRNPGKRLFTQGEIDVRRFLPQAMPDSFDGLYADLIDAANLNKFFPGFVEYAYRMLKRQGFLAAQVGSGSLAPQDTVHLAKGIADFRKVFMGNGRKGSVWLWEWPIESFVYPQVWLCGWKEAVVEPPVLTWQKIRELFDVEQWKLDRPFFSPEVVQASFIMANTKDFARLVGWQR